MARAILPLTVDRLRALLDYNPETGVFTCLRKDSGYRKKVGTISCTRSAGHAYIAICLDGRKYLAQVLAYLWMEGRWPTGQVDHRDNNSLNNKWSNLRDGTQSQNQRNRSRINKNNTSGATGVDWDKRKRKWRVRVCEEHIGYFDDKGEAIRISMELRRDWRGGSR